MVGKGIIWLQPFKVQRRMSSFVAVRSCLNFLDKQINAPDQQLGANKGIPPKDTNLCHTFWATQMFSYTLIMEISLEAQSISRTYICLFWSTIIDLIKLKNKMI